MRLATLFSVLTVLVLSFYFILIVWSYCDDLKASSEGNAFTNLLIGSGEMRIKRQGGFVDGYTGASFVDRGQNMGGFGSMGMVGKVASSTATPAHLSLIVVKTWEASAAW